MSDSGPGGVDPEWAWKVATVLMIIGSLMILVMVGML